MESSIFQVYRDEHYQIEQCFDCPVPGYLIVSPLSSASSVEELTKEEQTALGEILAKSIKAVKEMVQPVRVYCAQFGEKNDPLHFHIFPRTEEITREYERENPLKEDIINGPDLLSWSRKRYTHYEDQGHLRRVIHQIQEALKNTWKTTGRSGSAE